MQFANNALLQTFFFWQPKPNQLRFSNVYGIGDAHALYKPHPWPQNYLGPTLELIIMSMHQG